MRHFYWRWLRTAFYDVKALIPIGVGGIIVAILYMVSWFWTNKPLEDAIGFLHWLIPLSAFGSYTLLIAPYLAHMRTERAGDLEPPRPNVTCEILGDVNAEFSIAHTDANEKPRLMIWFQAKFPNAGPHDTTIQEAYVSLFKRGMKILRLTERRPWATETSQPSLIGSRIQARDMLGPSFYDFVSRGVIPEDLIPDWRSLSAEFVIHPIGQDPVRTPLKLPEDIEQHD